MRLAAQAKGGFYPTPPRVVDLLAELIPHPFRRLQQGPGEAAHPGPSWPREALAQMAGRMDNAIPIETYGVELHRDRAEEAEEAARPRPGLGPVRHVHSERGLRAAAPEPAV